MCPAAEDDVHEPGKLWFCHIPFVLLLWQTAFPEREHEGWWEDSRAAQSDEHTHRAGVRSPFCLHVRRSGMCPREADFWMKVAELFLWCSEVSTLHNGYFGKFTLGLFRQLLTTTNGEWFFFLPCHVRQVFTKSGFSEDGWHTLLISWLDFLRRNGSWSPSHPC